MKEKLRVVIFEDDDKLRDLLDQLITGTDELSCVGSYADALQLKNKLQELQPDLVLMDINLPHINGIEATKMIKHQFPSIKTCILTVFEDNDKIFDAICSGASGYLLKNTPTGKIIESLMEVHAGGSPMSPSVASKVLAVFRENRKAEVPGINALSSREKEVLDLMAKGCSFKMIAEQCGVTTDTVKFHAKNIYEKLHVNSKTEAVIKAMQHSKN